MSDWALEHNDRDVNGSSYSIVVISAYFGQLPNYFRHHLASLGANRSVDWILFTDCQTGEVPSNVKVVRVSWERFSERVRGAIDTHVQLDRPYKICDLRPAFGELFAAEISGYDFWGHCDLDVIFGDVRAFLTSEVLSTHDKILIRGNFSLYRNRPDINSAYRSYPAIASHKHAFAISEPARFDEWRGIHPIIQAAGISLWDKEVIFDLDASQFATRANSSKSGTYAYVYRGGQVFECDEQSLSILREGLLIHFQKRPLLKVPTSVSNEFVVGSDSILDGDALLPSYGRTRLGAARFYIRRVRERWNNLVGKVRRGLKARD